jgi:hypothetical protein
MAPRKRLPDTMHSKILDYANYSHLLFARMSRWHVQVNA